MENRGAWILGGLGLGFVALLLFWMGKTLDTKAPIRIERVAPAATRVVPTRTPEEDAAHEEASMRAVVTSRAARYAVRAAAQAFPAEDAARARCAFTGAGFVHRAGPTAFWTAAYSCTLPGEPGALPNLTSVSVRLRLDGTRWVVED